MLVGFFGGTVLVWLNGWKPMQPIMMGDTSFAVYIGLLALAANVISATACNVAFPAKLPAQAAA